MYGASFDAIIRGLEILAKYTPSGRFSDLIAAENGCLKAIPVHDLAGTPRVTDPADIKTLVALGWRPSTEGWRIAI